MKITIEEGLTLNNPTAEIIHVGYPQKANTVEVQVSFKEQNALFDHSRSYTFTNETGKDCVFSDVIELVKTNEVLNNFF